VAGAAATGRARRSTPRALATGDAGKRQRHQQQQQQQVEMHLGPERPVGAVDLADREGRLEHRQVQRHTGQAELVPDGDELALGEQQRSGDDDGEPVRQGRFWCSRACVGVCGWMV
jgi:hypothetical protein